MERAKRVFREDAREICFTSGVRLPRRPGLEKTPSLDRVRIVGDGIGLDGDRICLSTIGVFIENMRVELEAEEKEGR